MSPTSKELASKLAELFAEHAAPQQRISETQKKALELQSTDPLGASEQFGESAGLLRQRGLIHRATDEYLQKLGGLGVDPEYDFPYDVLPLRKERETLSGMRVVEVITEPRKEDVYATTLLRFFEKDQRGKFKYGSVKDVGIATLPQGVNKNDPDVIKTATQRVHNAKNGFKNAILSNQKAAKQDPSLIQDNVLRGTIKNLDPDNIGGVIGVMIEGNRRIWMKRQEKAEVKEALPSDPFDYVTNPTNRELFRNLIRDYSDIPTDVFIKKVIHRFGREQKSPESKGRGRNEGKILGPKEILRSPGVSQGIEMALAGRITHSNVIEELNRLLGTNDLVKLAERNGWKHNMPFEEEIAASAEKAFNHRERGRKQVNNDEQVYQLNPKINAMVLAITSKDRRKGWGRNVLNSPYSAVKFVYAVTAPIVGDIHKAHEVVDLLCPKYETVEHNGIPIEHKRV